MLWVKFRLPIRSAGGRSEATLVASWLLAYNATFSPGPSIPAGPLPRRDNQGNSTNMARLRGSVKWFDPEKGWGFIRLEDGDEVFVHHSDIEGTGFRSLRDGAEVELDVERADRGPRARNVVPLGGATAEADPSTRRTGKASDRAGGRNDSRRSRTRGSGRNRAESAGDPRDRQTTGSAPTLQTLNEQIRKRLATRFTFLR